MKSPAMPGSELSLPKKILILFEEVGRTFEDPYRAVWERMNAAEPVSKRTVRTTLDRLKRDGKLERVERGDKVIYRLTDGGRREVVRYTFSRKKWDGKWRLVAFDIPERRRRARDYLRDQLYELGFRQFQESLWISPFDVLGEIRDLRQEHHITPYVKLLTVEVVEDQDGLVRSFGLEGARREK